MAAQPYKLDLTDGARRWALEFTRLTGATLERRVYETTAIRRLAAPPASVPNIPRNNVIWVEYEPVVLPDQTYLVSVYAGYWIDSLVHAFRLKLVVVSTRLSPGAVTAWQLTSMGILTAPITLGVEPSTEDVVFAGTFRLTPCLTENPLQTSYSFVGVHLGDWYLPFWCIYHKTLRNGLLFVLDDHGTDQLNGPHTKGFAPGGMIAETTPGLFPHLLLRFFQHPPTDYTVPGRPAQLPDYVQSGTLAIQELALLDPNFRDWYDACMIYRRFVQNAPVVVERAQQGIPEPYRKVALAIGLMGQWGDIVSDGFDVRTEYANEVLSFIQERFPPGITPLVFSYILPWGLIDPIPQQTTDCIAPVSLPAPEYYAGFRPGVAQLLKSVHDRGGLAMGYVIPLLIPFSSSAGNLAWSFLREDGTRVTDLSAYHYCHSTPQMQNIWDNYLTNGALRRNPSGVYLDGLHVDGINPGTRCADGGMHPIIRHSHRSQTNETLEALDSHLRTARTVGMPPGQQRFFDQEVPLECLIHRFDSNDQNPIIQSGGAFPRLHRIVYGNLTRYSYPLFLYGYHPPSGTYPIVDLFLLHILTEGAIPLLFVPDAPGTILSDPTSNQAVIDLLEAYLYNYDSILRSFFEGELLPFPSFGPNGPPQCGFESNQYLFAIEAPEQPYDDPTRRILSFYPLVHGTAFRAATVVGLVMVDWAHACSDPRLCPPIGPSAATFEWRAAPCMVATGSTTRRPPTSPAFAPMQDVVLDLDSAALRLDRMRTYTIGLKRLSRSGSSPLMLIDPANMQPVTRFMGSQRVLFRLPASSLSVLEIRPA